LVLETGDGAAATSDRQPLPVRRLALGIAAALVVVLLVAAIALLPSGAGLDDLARSVVSLSTEDGLLGSGTIIDTRQGLILTNAHVVAPRAPGQGVTVGLREQQLPDEPRELIVGVSSGRDRPAEPRFRAEVLVADGYLDLAVIRITRTLTGSLVEPNDLTDLHAARLGASGGLRSGDPIRILGHPALAQSNAATLTEGVVAGIVPDPRLGSNRAYINLDATIRQGNSGGLVADRRGRVVGVPTLNWIGGTNTPVAAMRPIDLADGLIGAARSGENYTSPYVSSLNGREELTSVGFAALGSDEVRAGCDVPTYRPREGDTAVGVVVEYEGFSPGEHQDLWIGIWDTGSEDYVGAASTAEHWPVEFVGRGCVALRVPLSRPLGGRDDYEVDVHAAPNLAFLDGGYAFNVDG
jgi:S1-C subfamily serine protease